MLIINVGDLFDTVSDHFSNDFKEFPDDDEHLLFRNKIKYMNANKNDLRDEFEIKHKSPAIRMLRHCILVLVHLFRNVNFKDVLTFDDAKIVWLDIFVTKANAGLFIYFYSYDYQSFVNIYIDTFLSSILMVFIFIIICIIHIL